MREDPDRPGLLYAGTEFGVFVSFDDGRNWRSLQLNLPVTPVTGMRVHRQDLVISTQGRSFWILDDLTPLHELSDAVARSSAHLYTPRAAYRVNAAGITEVGEPVPEAHPGRALIHYYLAEAPDAEVRIEVLDATGTVARTFSSDSVVAAREGGKALEPAAGMNRLVWDLTYAGPDTSGGFVISGFAGGVKAPPGIYQVRLEAGGATQTRALELRKDPRLVDVTQADFEEGFRLGIAVRDTLSQIYNAIRRIGSVREQLETIAGRAAEAGYPAAIKGRADSIVARLTAVEEELRQVRNESNQDPLRFPPKLDYQYLTLYGFVTGTDNYSYGGPEGRPTAGAYARFADLNVEWGAITARLNGILTTEVAAFNASLVEQGVPAVIVSAREPGR